MQHLSDRELALRRSTLFCDVSPSVLHEIMLEAESVHFAPGEFLFRAGGTPDYLYVLVEGTVKMVVGAPGKQESVIELLQPADTVLISAVLTAKPYLMSALAIDRVHALAIPSELLRQHVINEPQLALIMIASLANHYRQMVLHVKNLRLRTSAQRLGVYLLGLAEKNGGKESVVLPHVKKLIASRLHMSPENMSRAIQALRGHGLEVVDDEVYLHDVEALRRYCEVDSLLGELDEEFVAMIER